MSQCLFSSVFYCPSGSMAPCTAKSYVDKERVKVLQQSAHRWNIGWIPSTSNILQNSCFCTKDKLKSPSCHVTAQRATLHTSISIGFSLHVRIRIYLLLWKSKPEGEEKQKGKRKIKLKVRQRIYEKVGKTNSQMNISRRQKTEGNEEENRKDVGNEHMSSQELYPKGILWSQYV